MADIKIKLKLVGSQNDFFKDDTTKLLHLSAGFGFGKTYSLCYKLLKLSRINKNLHGGLVVPTYTDFTRDVKPTMEDIFERHNINAKYHGQEHYFSFPWSLGRLYVATAERKLRGPNWAYAGINELTLLPLIRYQEVIGRVRVKNAKAAQIVSSGTPEGISSPYYSIFVEKPMAGSRILYGDTRENAHNLQAGYIENLLATYPEAMIDAYLKGLWVNLSGNRFYYSYDPIKHDKKIAVDEYTTFLCSMDFNVDPFCMAIWQKQPNFDPKTKNKYPFKLVGVDEIELSHGAGYRTENAIEALKARGYTPENTDIYPDPAGLQRSTRGLPDVKTLENAGYTVIVKRSAPRFRQRQLNINNGFEKDIISVNPATQPKMKRDLLAVEQDRASLEKIKKNHDLTHFSDGLDYLWDNLYPFEGHKETVHEVKIR